MRPRRTQPDQGIITSGIWECAKAAFTASWRTPIECAFDVPAKRSSRSCSTPTDWNPTQATRPRTNRLRSSMVRTYFVDPAIEKAEVAGVGGDQVAGQLADDPVERAGNSSANQSGPSTDGDYAVDVLVPFLPLGHETRNHLRRVLKVRRHEYDGIGIDELKSRSHTAVHPEVAGQLDRP